MERSEQLSALLIDANKAASRRAARDVRRVCSFMPESGHTHLCLLSSSPGRHPARRFEVSARVRSDRRAPCFPRKGARRTHAWTSANQVPEADTSVVQ